MIAAAEQSSHPRLVRQSSVRIFSKFAGPNLFSNFIQGEKMSDLKLPTRPNKSIVSASC